MKHSLIRFLIVVQLTFSSSILLAQNKKSEGISFNFKSLSAFYPSMSTTNIEKSLKDFKIQQVIKISENGDAKISLYKIKGLNVNVDIYTQSRGEKIISMYARLPQHLDHNPLLKELQGAYKKQHTLRKKDSSGIYIWNNVDGKNIRYQAICTLMCFPMFLEISENDPTTKPLSEILNESIY